VAVEANRLIVEGDRLLSRPSEATISLGEWFSLYARLLPVLKDRQAVVIERLADQLKPKRKSTT
jgi:hypothetical protein